jgi:hypothetical protein
MRRVLFWIVEQVCRPYDALVCDVANVTDEPEQVSPSRLGLPLSA